ncbi:hypothetical protein AGR7A_pAt10083 [Agrobacterium deltaense NCPPB 1641]|uniref:Uncharacterized protein n=1 Tax=Agrobacterium deltaense NCPPB 1641 TaxID=1183425 RepID=A0A1S7U7Z9_9HYPH|nr:hypothetical protein AGR7A_pAt10083 [Agrobacterium deltaense NCPPB 1641]
MIEGLTAESRDYPLPRRWLVFCSTRSFPGTLLASLPCLRDLDTELGLKYRMPFARDQASLLNAPSPWGRKFIERLRRPSAN